MNEKLIAFVARLESGQSVDLRESRVELSDLWKEMGSAAERVAYLEVRDIFMDFLERSSGLDGAGVERLRAIRQAEYEFLLTQEAMLDGENVDPDHLLAVGEREVAARRLSKDSDFMKFAAAGSRVLGRTSPAKKGWLRRLLS